MAKVETITFAEAVSEIVRTPENYTQVTGIYTLQVTPQFLNAPDNVQQPPAEIVKAVEEAYAQQELRFFRML